MNGGPQFSRAHFPAEWYNKIVVPFVITHGEAALRMLVGETFYVWDVASRKVYMELVVSKLEGHSMVQGCVPCPKALQFKEESCARSNTTVVLTPATYFSPLLGIWVQVEKRD